MNTPIKWRPAPRDHDHDDRYYTEAEVDAKIDAAYSAPWDRGALAGSADADTITAPGTVSVPWDEWATPALNFPPTGRAGQMTVWDATGGTVWQEYVIPAVGEVWTRNRYAGSWSAWSLVGAKPALAVSLGTTNLDTLRGVTETYAQASDSNVTIERGYPPIEGQWKSGTLTVTAISGGISYQVYVVGRSGEAWARNWYVNAWRPWARVGGSTSTTVPSLGDADLDVTRTTGPYAQPFDNQATTARHYPPIEGQYKSGWLQVVDAGGGIVYQLYTVVRTGEMWVRNFYVNTWRDWVRASGGGGGGESSGGGTGALARIPYEETGEYTTPAQADTYLTALAAHRNAEKFVIGQTVRGVDIPAVSIGDPSKPALYVGVGVHGSEVGCRDGALLWVRDLLSTDSYMQMDMCIVVVPNINIDMWNNTYNNANNVNINSDFFDKTQPETQAISGLLSGGQFDFVAGVDVHNFGYEQQTSIRYPEEAGAAHLDVQAQASALYDAVFAAHEADGYSIRRYGDPGNPGSQWRALAQQWALPSLLIEIASYQPSNPKYAHNPRTAEAARVKNALNAVAHHVWENLSDIVAARNAGLADPVPVTPIPAP